MKVGERSRGKDSEPDARMLAVRVVVQLPETDFNRLNWFARRRNPGGDLIEIDWIDERALQRHVRRDDRSSRCRQLPSEVLDALPHRVRCESHYREAVIFSRAHPWQRRTDRC